MSFIGRSGTILSLVLITSSLAGCISNRNDSFTANRTDAGAMAQQQQINAAAGTGGAPTSPPPRPNAVPQIINKSVVAGSTIEIVRSTSVNPDCTPDTLGTIRITQQPMHGKAVVVQRDGFPTFPATNPRSACNKTKTPSIAVDYTPDAGFTGSDLMAVEVFFHSGADTGETKIIITVK